MNIEKLYKLAEDRPLKTSEIHEGNDFYGHATILKNYANIPQNYQIKAAIEHGPTLEPGGWKADFNAPLPALFTFSSFRHSGLKNYTNKKIFSIGPMLSYAQDYLSLEKLQLEKERLGRNLLVFPPHSTHWVYANYEIYNYVKLIQQIGKNFNSIRICLYWKDILRGVAEEYMKHGFECVTAGHIYDHLFLSRLKSFIDASTVTTSCQIGTHIGYCIMRNKPHYFYEINVNVASDSKERLSEYDDYSHNVPANLIRKNFNKLQDHITSEQKDIINTYWGVEEFKTKKEIKNILKITESLYKKNKRFLCAKRNLKNSEFLFDGTLNEILKILERDLKKYQRRKTGKLRINQKAITFVDLHSFYYQTKQIFESNLYGFSTENKRPVILDCGAHIGLASIYFAKRYSDAVIYAFEADPEIAKILKDNIKSFGLNNVITFAKAVWIDDGHAFFNNTSDDSGYVNNSTNKSGIKISTFRLRNFLKENMVELLKMDIEGAEYEVIKDCDGVLSNANKVIIEVHKLRNDYQSIVDILIILEKNNFEYTFSDLHSADWIENSKKPPFSAVTCDKYIVTIFAWQKSKGKIENGNEFDITIDQHTELFRQCIDHINKNENDDALKYINYAIKKYPEVLALNYGKAIVLARKGLARSALEALKALLDNQPDHKNAKLLFEALNQEFVNVLNDKDIVIASYPRSGNTWIRLLLSDVILQLHGLETNTFLPIHFDHVIPNIHAKNLHLIDSRIKLPFRLIKTHQKYSEIPQKTILLFRHPADALCSYYHFHRRYEHLKKYVNAGIDKFCLENVGEWCDHIVSYIDAKNVFSDKIFFVSYELLHYQAEKALIEIADFLGLKITKQMVQKAIKHHTFQKHNQQEKLSGEIGTKYNEHFFRKGLIGTHKEELKQETIRSISSRTDILYKQAIDFQNRLYSHHKGEYAGVAQRQ
jgi:FkbM family methyltransferase